MTCTAFPGRIPIEIASGELDHLVIRPGQVGETIFEVVERPSDIQHAMIEAAAARGARWAQDALAKSPV